MAEQINKPDYFNITQIADSGQCFRFTKLDKNKYSTVYKENYLEIEEREDKLLISCDLETWNKVWIKYFDLDTDYSKYADILNNLGSDYDYIKRAFEYSKGIRILRQDSFEMLISYIISQRNRIPKIATSVERLSRAFGKELKDKFTGKIFYSFPNEHELSTNINDYADIKLGYRDEYVACAVSEVRKNGIDFYNTLDKTKSLYGVGDKVANCYLLFGRHDITRFPIDVWIQRILDREFDGYLSLNPFKEFAGVVQQYMFYFERNMS